MARTTTSKPGSRTTTRMQKATRAFSAEAQAAMKARAKDGKVLCFFQSAGKFKTRYATFGFSDQATLDDSGLWPTSFAIHRFGDAEAATLAALLRKAAG